MSKIEFSNKFSNVSVFGRREKNILYIKNLKRYTPLKLYNVKRNPNKGNEHRKINSDINSILGSFYTFNNSEVNKRQKKDNNDISNQTVMSLFNKTCNNFKNNFASFYLTETEPSTSRENKKSNYKKICWHKKLKLDISNDDNNNTTNKLNFLNNCKTFGKLNDFFMNNEKEKKRKKNINKTFDLLDNKLNKIKIATNDNFYNAKQFIDKTRKLALFKYNLLINKEVDSRINENNNNYHHIIENKINSLNNIKKIYDQVFNEKLLEYIKFISIKKDYEEKYDLGLLNQIYLLKSEISLLTNKIRKVQFEKNNIIQWILLQIKVKERKLNLPSYYTNILEINKPILENQRHFAKVDKTKIPKFKTRKTKSIIINNIKNISIDTDNIFNNISKEELNKILFYRQNLIFITPDDFIYGIDSIENKNIKLLEKLEFLSYEIRTLKQQYYNLINNKDFFNSSFDNQIKKYEIELKQNKQIYREKTKFLVNYKDTNNEKSKTIKKEKSEFCNIELINNEIILNQKKSKLFTSAEKLFSTCKEIIIDKKEFNPKSKNDIILKRTNKNQGDIILRMLEYIEVKITKLLLEFQMYKDPKNQNYNFIRNLRMRYNKKRNLEKAQLARLEHEKKNLKLLQHINEKNEEFLFLKRNKKDLENHFGRVNSQISGKKRKKIKIFIPGFDEFLFGDLIQKNMKSERNEQ